MKLMGGSTNMADGFKATRTSLFRTSNESSVPVVFFITDGEPTGESPQPEIMKLLELKPKPQIIGIGVGAGCKIDNLRRLLAGQHVFHMSDYATLNSVIQGLILKPQHLEPAIRLYFTPGCASLQKSRSDLTIKVLCQPDDPLTVLPVGTKIKFLANEFFFGASGELDTPATLERPFELAITLKIKPNAILFGEFPEKIWYEATIPAAPRGRYKGYVDMVLGWMAGDFIYDKDPERDINVLLWGPMGSGKTSVINGIITVFSPKMEVLNPLTAARKEDHVTRSYSANAITDWIDDDTLLGKLLFDNLKLRFWDPWGLTVGNFKTLSLLHFLEGRVRPGAEMNDRPCHDSVEERNIIDAVILLIPIGTSQDPQLLDTLAKNIETILDCKMSPIIVINFINDLKSEEEISKAYEIIYQASHLTKKDIFMLDNYVDEKYRNMEKDLLYWSVLKKVFSEAKKNIERRGKEKSGGRSQGAFAPLVRTESPVRSPPSPGGSGIVARNEKGGAGEKICKNDQCENAGKVVEFPRCPFCGGVPELNLPPVKICTTPKCEGYSKPVEYPRCPFCGNPPGGFLGATSLRVCTNDTCSNSGKEVPTSFPRCPFCGETPGHKVEKPKIRSCVNPGCGNYGKVVPANFPLCPYCGTSPLLT